LYGDFPSSKGPLRQIKIKNLGQISFFDNVEYSEDDPEEVKPPTSLKLKRQ